MTKLIALILPLLLIIFSITGCSSKSEYLRPMSPVPEQWPEGARVDGNQNIKNIDWRSYFSDDRLNALISSALEHNRDMRIAVARVEESRALYGIQRSNLLPTVNVGVGQNTSRTPSDLSPTGRDTVIRRSDIGVSMLSFEIDFWGRVANLTESAKAAYLATDEAMRAFRLSLIADVADAYLTLKESEELVLLAQSTQGSRFETLRLIGARRDVGLAGDLDYLQADGAYQAARIELINLDKRRVVAQNFLNALVGIQKTDWPSGANLNNLGISLDLEADLPSELLIRRPDILAAEQRLISSNANLGAARAAFFPRISLTALAGTASNSLSGLFDSGSGAWNFQSNVVLPIFDFGRTASNVDIAIARKNIAVAEYEKVIQQAFREVADLLATRQKLAEQLIAQESLDQAQRQRLILAEARYNQGVASYLEVLDAQRDSFSAQQEIIRIRRSQLSTAAQLYKALGGGG
jgi:multidrug efflux system outer membrane protein